MVFRCVLPSYVIKHFAYDIYHYMAEDVTYLCGLSTFSSLTATNLKDKSDKSPSMPLVCNTFGQSFKKCYSLLAIMASLLSGINALAMLHFKQVIKISNLCFFVESRPVGLNQKARNLVT